MILEALLIFGPFFLGGYFYRDLCDRLARRAWDRKNNRTWRIVDPMVDGASDTKPVIMAEWEILQ